MGLVLGALLVACGSNYSSSTDGLLVVGSQGSGLLETFYFNLNTGGIGSITNSPNDTGNETCVLNGSPSNMVMDPAGVYVYVIFNVSPQCPNQTEIGIATFQVKSNGTIVQVGSLLQDPNPVSLSMDPAGKFLFVAEGTSTAPCIAGTQQPPMPPPTAVCVYSIGSNATLTAVPQTFVLPVQPVTPNYAVVAPTPTVFPKVGINGTQNSVCSIPGSTPPTSQYLYAVDSSNYQVIEFTVDTSSGVLGYPSLNPVATDKVPAGIAVDPCDRFVYISDSLTNKISAYLICTVVINPTPCPYADGSLVQVPGSPFTMPGNAEGPGPILVDPFGNNVYALNTLSNTISQFKISSVSGSLAALTTATVQTGAGPMSMTIRQDDNWLFVTNYGNGALGGSTVSQYSIAPATGLLTALPVIQTDNYPFGVAVK